MANTTPAPKVQALIHNKTALAMVAQAKVLSGVKLEQLVTRIQRQFGQTREVCWAFLIQYGLKGSVDHRRWSNAELQTLHEELLRHSVEEVAEILHRSPEAIRSKLKREGSNLRDVRGDFLSLANIACALHVQRSEVLHWITEGWLSASVRDRDGERSYSLSLEALNDLYKRHLPEVLSHSRVSQALLEAYLHYCSAPNPSRNRERAEHYEASRAEATGHNRKKSREIPDQLPKEDGDGHNQREQYGVAL